ncbi:hypothetical protein [Verminephrobacter eiseniae]|uniref:hypothetical protein n=1 Tax=Verminephrobacter eiseniae TaxID=364317 RepID=UPI002238931D|nr:hypothetical protein [Verminephrobacter eiseniae]MCW5238355.1 hypothetical protein [Verminephrobacter eiseniae]
MIGQSVQTCPPAAGQAGGSSHCASVTCCVPAALALAFLADGRQLGRWALGCWQTEPDGDSANDGLLRGHSLFDGQPTWVRPVVEPQRLSAARPPEGAHTVAEGGGTPSIAARPSEGAHTAAEGEGTPSIAARPPEGAHTAAEGEGTPSIAARPPEGAHTVAEGEGTPSSAARRPEGAHTAAEGEGAPSSVIYHVGSSPSALTARIRATVQPVHTPVGAPRPDGACRISLHAERPGDMDDARWLRLVRCHEVEVLLIQAQLRLLQAAQPPATPVCNPCGEAR